MYEYIHRLCACGMRVDRAYSVVNSFYRDLDFDGLRDFVRTYENNAKIIKDNVD